LTKTAVRTTSENTSYSDDVWATTDKAVACRLPIYCGQRVHCMH